MILGEVENLYQPQSLFGSIETEPQPVLRQRNANGCCYGLVRRVYDVELRESLRLGLQTCRDIVERGTKNLLQNVSFLEHAAHAK